MTPSSPLRLRRVAALIAVAAFTASCGGGSDSDAPSASPGDVVTTPVSTAPAETAPPEITAAPSTANSTTPPPASTVAPTTEPGPTAGDIVGRWAHYDVVAYEDGVLKTLIISYGFNDFTEVDGEIIDQASFCFSEQRTDQPIETSLSDAATQAIVPPPTPLGVEIADGTLTIRREATPTPVGIRLDDPANESLPTDPNDPRIVDDDGDGKPGLTVSIQVSEDFGGELYIARREIFSYDAELVEPDRLVGTVTDDSEQLVIGASDPIFDQGDANWEQFDDPARNPIILVRVDDDWDCERLAAERDALFPPTPEVDW